MITSSLQPAPRGARAPSKWARAVSLGAYFALLTLAFGFVVSRQVSAEIGERSVAFGRQLDDFQEFRGKSTRLTWNGQAVSVSTLVMEQPIEQTLARFVDVCDASTGALPEELASILGGRDGRAGLLQRMLVMRDLFPDGTGSVVCLSGLGTGGLFGLLQRVRRFGANLDVSELGQLRFAFLRKVSDARTHVVLASADGPLRLDRLVPLDGRDAEGSDVVEGVRPADSTRLFSASAQGTPHVITAYRSRLSAESALTDYGQKLIAKSFVRAATVHAQDDGGASTDAAPERWLTEAFRDGPRAVVVTSHPDEESGGSLLSVVQLAVDAIPGPFQAAEVGRSLVGRGRLGAPRDPAFE